MSQIVSPKTYTGKELETIFFRPMLTGKSAKDLGIKVMYNMPVPTTFNFWRGGTDILKQYSSGWGGGEAAEKYQKTIAMNKVKAEMGYSASDYFTMVFEQISGRADVNFEDLTGTQLEEAETTIFRNALAESIRATMWLGNTKRTGGKFNTFNGLLTQLVAEMDAAKTETVYNFIEDDAYNAPDAGDKILKAVWDQADVKLRELKSQNQLVFFVTSDIYSKYEESLDGVTLEAAYIAKQQGRPSLSWRGIPVVDMQVSGYLKDLGDASMVNTWAILTDRRNVALAVNTSDFPGTEIRMWYNPDEMENRQRAVFAAGCDYLLPEFVSFMLRS